MKTKLITILLFTACAFCACTKKYCWVIKDATFNDMGTVCDKTESELQDYLKAWCAACKFTYTKQN
jgi:hypothetical protein